jgi:hypothetical protein
MTVVVVNEPETSRSHRVALLGMAQHSDLMTAALQFGRDPEHRRHVPTTIPCDD